MQFSMQRTEINKLIKQYKGYLELYSFVNNGSMEGAATFAEFYWRMTYYSKYEDIDGLDTSRV